MSKKADVVAWAPDAEHSSPAPLVEVAKQVRDGGTRTETVRTLLSWFGAQRRGVWVSERVRNALSGLRLRTVPDFEQVSIDVEVKFLGLEAATIQGSPVPTAAAAADPIPGSAVVVDDAVPRVGMLPSANSKPITTTRDESVARACSIMLTHDYSQLPVVSGRSVVGMFSWKSLGEARAVGKTCEFVRECMSTEPLILAPSKPLLEAVEQIAQREVALVVQHNDLVGIVTTTDLSLQFHSTTRPFLLLGSIENQLRALLSELPLATLQSARSASPPAPRPLNSVHDMTFGEYVRLLQSESVWPQLAPALDRATIVALLDEVRGIRNDVMHFHPDPVGDVELKRLENALRLLHMLRGARETVDQAKKKQK